MSEKSPKNIGLKLSIGLYLLCVIGLIGSYFAISNRQIRHAVYAQASPYWTLGESNYFRAAFLNVITGKTYNKGRATLTVGDAKTVEEPKFGYVSFQIQPKSQTDSATLDFDVDGENLNIKFPIQLKTSEEFSLPKATLRRTKEDRKRKVISEWSGEDTIEIIPQSAEVVRGLPNDIYFITRRTGKPTSMTFKVLSHEGVVDKVPKLLKSNIFGVGKFSITPITSLRLELESVGTETTKTHKQVTHSKGKINLFAIAAQFNFETRTPYVPYDDVIQGRVESVRQSGSILVDGHEKDRWVSGGVFGLNKQGGGFEIKSAKQGNLMQVQVYHNFYIPGTSWASRWVAIGESKYEDDYCHVFKALAHNPRTKPLSEFKWVKQILSLPAFEKITQRECRFLLRAYLNTLPNSFVNSHTIVNSREKDLKKLNDWKEDKKEQLKWMTGIVLTGGFLCILWLVLVGIKKQKGFQRELENIADDENLPEDRFENVLFYLRILTILIALGTFIASMLMVMSFM